jgi:phosphoribosyl-ATP pyrophosphohydrolase
MAEPPSSAVLDRLSAIIAERRTADPESSYTARLFQRGIPKIAQKVGEEAVETVIEGVRGKPKRLVMESADLLFHLLVLWEATGVKPDAVWRELVRREKGGAIQRDDDLS